MPEIVLALLVPLAAWGGWQLARSLARSRERRRERQFSSRYFQGLNFLLNEEQDKAIKVFLQMAEVNQDTVETHLALGNLFRRRGEVDRAIRLHQNVISKNNLDDNLRTKALLELGEDYMRAGLYDRAERLFGEMLRREAATPTALRHLLDIYQLEKDWDKALDMARQLGEVSERPMGPQMAQFCCELAELALASGQSEAALKHLRQARRHDAQAVRPRIIQARVARDAGDTAAAMDAWEEVVAMDPDRLSLVLADYLAAAEAGGAMERARAQLREWCARHSNTSVALAISEDLRQHEGVDPAAQFLAAELARNPSVKGLDKLLELKLEGGTEIKSGDEILRAVAQKLLARQPSHRCSNCGYSGHTHYWQCPSCRNWNTTRPIHGVLGI